MSSNFDKIVKLACKPKNAPPKSKYVDVLVSATFADDGSLNDILRSLSLRLREPNAVVVFKALLTLHQMIRSGSTDQLLEVMAQGDQLRLQNVGGGNWEGYTPPSSMSAYGAYLHSRVKAWKDLKHDLVAVQTESNRRSNGLGAGSKARRLRHLPVDKGLLREVKQVQTVLNALIQCKFYDDDLRDENTVLAFRMLVKDLLVLFQAGNEGVCNILEHYFEMSKQDASESFDIYKSFIRQTDKVVDYLGVAKKLHNIVNVPVPNLKHAPTGLVKALEEYLNDPNFEQNRREYKASLGVVEGKGPARTPSPNPPSTSQAAKPAVSSSSASQPSQPTSTTNAGASSLPPAANQKIQDFFESIQSDQQPTMFGGPPQGFAGQQQQQQVPFNPFRQSMMMPQQTGFMQPQMTGYGGMPGQQQMGQAPFLAPQMTGQMAFGQAQPAFGQQPFGQNQQPFGQGQPFTQPQQTRFMQPQQTGFVQQPQPLQPQTTGSNPFRQSMMLLNTTGTGMPPHAGAMSQPASPFGMAQPQIPRPGSTPALSATSPPKLVAQATGSKNPFAPAPGTVSAKPQEPKGMSMAEMAWNKQFGQQTQSGAAQASPWGSANGQQTNGNGSQAASNGTGMGDVASAFNFDFSKPSSAPNDFMSQFGSLSVNTNTTGTGTSATSPTQFNSLSSNPTGFTSNTSGFSSPVKTGSSGGPLQPQTTGFGGSAVKRFQPTSSFGSQLVSELPPIHEPGSNATSPNHVSPGVGNVNPQQTGFPGLSSFSQPQTQGQNGQPAQLGQQGLSPQQTGGPNPFRQSMFGLNSNNTGGPSQPFGSGGPFGATGSNGQSGPFGGSSPFAGQNKPQGQPWQGAFGQQQQQGGSLL